MKNKQYTSEEIHIYDYFSLLKSKCAEIAKAVNSYWKDTPPKTNILHNTPKK